MKTNLFTSPVTSQVGLLFVSVALVAFAYCLFQLESAPTRTLFHYVGAVAAFGVARLLASCPVCS